MRNMSFGLTQAQMRADAKDVTRRMGWLFLVAGMVLNACVKCMGLKRGEKIEIICRIVVLSVRREPLRAMTDDLAYGQEECRREGFPDMTPAQFVEFFCATHKGCTPDTVITRIEFMRMES